MIRANQNNNRVSSIIRLPQFMHRTPLILHPQPGVEGDSGYGRLSQHSLGTTGNAVAQTTLADVDGQLGVDRYQLERSIFDQKIRDANQLGIRTEALWPQVIPEDSVKTQSTKNPNENSNMSGASKLTRQKITHTIYNMIESETFAEAMAAHLRQQEEAARPADARTDERTDTTERNGQDVSIDIDNPPTNEDVK
ncbi:uncharacterized protein [Venturia canescens]|uniref:uncharacterized protein isoform X2 n=1 Tax=Venturia canescens TaxID=32260 RepID=UPI001C9D324E|nr:uncharacterized protein LOC122408090 isoform X2 [Venturia canescens]XP_043270588.1 uncharacterized protein LOC122408090 isoform X2 [Venturia canescens]XP_043270589.1 uncharacterized protein LOC122408090 isoform X2 [Venturia canescens]